MNKTWQHTLLQIGIALPLSLATAIISTAPKPTFAQLIPDNTLGAENSIVTPEALRDLIEGGAIRGDNLFHSFTEFNINDGQNVFFANPEGILNILTRVTGGNPSSIFGTLGVDGAANLFLLNPNGIIFGENAQLSLTGSFLATTADSFIFADGFEFSASNPQAPPLLTVNIPIGLRFRDNPGNIAVNQSNLTVNQGQNLSLIGGNVSVTGSGDITNLQGSLTAPGGRIELGSLTATGTVNLNPDLSLVFPDGVARGDISLTEAATLSVVSDTIGFNGGSVALLGQNLFITSDSAVLAGIGAGLGGEGVTSGDIDLNATGAVTISDSFGENTLPPGALTQGRGVQNRLNEGATGTGGNVNVTADSLSITDGGFISISTFGFGDAGNINVNVAGELVIDGENETSFSRFSNVVGDSAVGDSGDIIINADSVSLSNAGTINTNVFAATFDEDGVQTAPGGVGNGGDILITTNTFNMNSEADINTGTSGVGNAGNVLINATGNVTIDGEIGERFFTRIVSNVNAGAQGDAGDITINAASFSLLKSAQIQTGLFAGGEGNAGDVVINVTDDITIGGRDSFGNSSAIFNDIESGVIGDAGNVTIQAGGNVTFDDGFVITNIAAGAQGNAGNITINATSLNLLYGSQLQTVIQGANGDTPGGIGNAGNVQINVTGDVTISGSNTNESPSGIFNEVLEGAIGDAGNITITGNSIFVEGGFLDSRNFSDGNSGNTALNASDTVSINNESLIRTSGKLGNISIGNPLDGDTTFTPREVVIDSSFISSGNSIVTASQFDNVEIDGGNISIYALESISVSNTQDVITSQIATATSRLGDAGNVILQTLDSGQITFDNTAIATGVNVIPADDGTIDLQGIGNGGTLEIITGSLSVNNGSFLSSGTSGIGNAALITINAAESTSITDSNITNFVSDSSVGNGNNIIINTPSLFLSNGNISAFTFGQGNAGNIQINASDFITFVNESIVQAATFNQGDAGSIDIEVGDGVVSLDDSLLNTSVSSGNIGGEDLVGNGNAGDININAGSISVTNGAQLSSSTGGIGNAGNIILNAGDTINFDGFDASDNVSGAFSQVNSNGIGNAGDIEITADSLFLTNGAQVSSSTLGQGNAGNITINADDTVSFSRVNSDSSISGIFSQVGETGVGNGGNINLEAGSLLMDDSALISTDTSGQGNAGIITLNVSGLTSLDDLSNITSEVNTTGIGNAGEIEITTNSLSLTNGATLSSSVFGQGNGGNISINARDTLSFDGIGSTGFSSGAFSNFQGMEGDRAGNIEITADSLSLTNGGQVSVTTLGQGDAGNIKLNVSDTIFIEGISSNNRASGVFSTTGSNSTGNAGSITIDPQQVTIRDGGTISVQSLGEGLGGDILLISDNLTVDNASINAQTANTDGGNIIIEIADLLLLRNGATISASAGGIGDGGNLTINTDFLVAFPQENSDISANAVDGQGGNVNINATNIFGIEPRDGDSPLSDITASSEFGVSGEVIITQPETDPSQGIIELPETVIDSDEQIAENVCQLSGGNQFVATGRGGIPTNPNDAINSDNVRVYLVQPVASSTNSVSIDLNSLPLDEEGKPIMPARGWIFTEDGKVILTSYDPNQIDSQRLRGTQTTCSLH